MAIKKKIALNALTGQFDLITKSLPATNVDFTPTAGIAATNVQAAIAELESDVAGAYIPLTQKAANNGVATLDSLGKIPQSQIPAVAITDTFVVASQAAMLALTGAAVGDIAVRTDLNKTFILKGPTYSVLSDWQELLTPTDLVTSVNGQTGAVTLTTTNIAEGTNLYYTDARFDTRLATKSTTNLTEGTNLYFTNARAQTAAVQDAIVDAVTNIAPSQNAVFDALALKQATGNYITALTGDVTAAGPNSATATLATVNSNLGTFGTATQTSTVTVNAKGLVTAASNTSIQIAESQVTNLVAD